MDLSLFNREASKLLDPKWEERTQDEKASFERYVKTHNTAISKYEVTVNNAREEYRRNRKGYILGIFKPPTFRQMFYQWPNDQVIAVFDNSEMSQLQEFENAIFFAARTFETEERDARFDYWASAEQRAV
jgi:hypothetical protein